MLDIAPQQVEQAAADMNERVAAKLPQAQLQGFTVQPMIRRRRALELIIGMVNDAQFGPVMLFGHGGTAVEVLDDKALALPPLNLYLARDMIQRTQVLKLLCGYRDVPARLDEGLLIRPVVPEDQPNLLEAFPQMPEFTSMRLSQIDYDRQIVLVLTRPGIPGRQPIYGAARLQEDPDRTQARLYLAITVDFTGRGLGSELLRHVLRYAASRGLRRIEAVVDTAGSPLASLYEAHGFVRAGHSAKRKAPHGDRPASLTRKTHRYNGSCSFQGWRLLSTLDFSSVDQELRAP